MQKLVITTITSGLLAASSAVAGDFSAPITTAAAPATAPSIDGFSGALSADYSNIFNFRGANLGNDHVATGLTLNKQCPLTGLDLSLGALYHSVEDWGNVARGTNSDRLDLSLSTSKDLGFAKAHLGYIHYNNFNDRDDAQEVAFGLSKELYGLNTSLTYFWDVETDNGGYTELNLSKGIDVLGNAINIGAAVGYLVEEGGFSHATLSASYDIAFGKATLTPYVAQVWELDELESVAGEQDNEFIGGLKLSVNF